MNDKCAIEYTTTPDLLKSGVVTTSRTQAVGCSVMSVSQVTLAASAGEIALDGVVVHRWIGPVDSPAGSALKALRAKSTQRPKQPTLCTLPKRANLRKVPAPKFGRIAAGGEISNRMPLPKCTASRRIARNRGSMGSQSLCQYNGVFGTSLDRFLAVTGWLGTLIFGVLTVYFWRNPRDPRRAIDAVVDVLGVLATPAGWSLPDLDRIAARVTLTNPAARLEGDDFVSMSDSRIPTEGIHLALDGQAEFISASTPTGEKQLVAVRDGQLISDLVNGIGRGTRVSVDVVIGMQKFGRTAFEIRSNARPKHGEIRLTTNWVQSGFLFDEVALFNDGLMTIYRDPRLPSSSKRWRREKSAVDT